MSRQCTNPLITFFFVVTLLFVNSQIVECQTPARGFQPGRSYALSDIETINTTNGNLMLNLALGKLAPGRGGLSGQLNLRYDSKLYDSHTQYYEDWEHPIFGQPQVVIRNMLTTSDQGGWRYGTGYELQLIDRMSQYPVESQPQFPANEAIYRWKVKVAFPDGSVHEFLPRGFGNPILEGYIDIRPDGWQTRWVSSAYTQEFPYLTNTLTYYTFDGSYIRLDVQHDSDGDWWNNPWTLYFPDGSKVTNNGARITDRNGNYVEWSNITYNGHPATQLMDQLGRKIVVEYGGITDGEVIHFPGVGGVDLTCKVRWKTIQIFKTYSTELPGVYDTDGYPDMLGLQFVVSEIELPAATGGLKYVFGYNAADFGSAPCCTPSYGWGELSSVTTPTGAQAQYQYWLDGQNGPGFGFMWTDVLQNSVTRKSLTYQQQYDGSSTPVTETWNYNQSIVGGDGSIIMPNGGVIKQLNDGQRNYRTENADGTLSEKLWQANQPQGFPLTSLYDPATGIDTYDPERANSYVKTEFTSIRDANGTLTKTAIKDHNYDKNGNVTSVKEYDWVDYGSVPRGGAWSLPTGIPASAVLRRVTTNSYAGSTPDASDSSSNDADSYWNSTSSNLRLAVATTEVSNGVTTSARTEFFYDSAGTTGNLTQKKIWDSTRGTLTRPLTAANSISLSSQYGLYGNVTLATDARGVQTTFTYGAINGVTNLYPTQIIVGSNYPAFARRTSNEYDFYTGLVTRVTDVDNNVASSTTYDVFGRPILVKEAEGKTEETRTSTEYSDLSRRVIIRSDLSAIGDGKLATVQHFDQLGRIRLSRQLEDATTQSPTDETLGIKTQTRYIVTNPCAPTNTEACLNSNVLNLASYELVSNPYRAATSVTATSEQSMGWMRSKSDKGGRTIEVETFGGASLPFPWGVNSTSTGKVTSGYNANFTTVSDQVGKVRRTMSNAFGELVRVDEPDNTNNLGSTSAPVQPTTYNYDVLGNMTSVNQGVQTRTFTYSSLSRLTSVFQPENGTKNHQYDENGNLLVVTDARNVSTHFSYDVHNRIIRRWYNSSSNTASTLNNNPVLPSGVSFTEESNYHYDAQSLPNGAPIYNRGQSKGRLVALTYGTGSSAGDYYSYDPFGRQVLKIQRTGGINYQISATFNRAGIATQVVYPSGHTTTQSLDSAGRIAGVSGNLGNGTSRSYSTGILYSPGGSVVKEQFGTITPTYKKLFYNSRGQLTEIRASTSYTGPTDTNWNRGLIINHYSDQCSGLCLGSAMTDNNGTLKKQEVYIPTNDQISSYTLRLQQYAYDVLNRVYWVRELTGGIEQWKQQFSYDRWGNRTIDSASTYGIGINNKAFTVDPANNRLGVPSGQPGAMSYDLTGNLTNDTYSGMGIRTYDALNRMTSAWGGNNQLQQYSYDAWGKRVRRTVNTSETWHVYGLADELIAEYAANASATNPQREYGYRNADLLVVAEGSGAINWLIKDHLGSPRMLFDATGNLATVKRHDYMPFGEELFAPIAGRSASQGYASGDGIRQQFTTNERDSETNLDYCEARYYSSVQGRFVAPDPLNASASASLPQSWNRYSYVLNKPLQLVDPTGMSWAMRYVGEGKDRMVEFIWYTGALTQDQVAAGWDPYDQLWYFADTGAIYLGNDGPHDARIIPASVFDEEGLGSPGYSVIRYADPSNMNDYQRSVLFAAFRWTHKGDPNSYMRGFWETFFLSLTFGQIARPAQPAVNPRLGDLTAAEAEQIQAAVNQVGRPLEVVGSAASGTRRGLGTALPIGKGPGTRSDIDYLVGGSSRDFWKGFEGRLPSIDPKTGIITGTQNPFMGPGIRFEPNVPPWKLP